MEELKKDDKFKNFLIVVSFFAFICYSIYGSFFKTSNEIGFLGVDKAGRQIFIQTLDGYLQPGIKVDSDFFDHNFISRFFIQEPMRTTIRFDVQDSQNKLSLSTAENFLSQLNEDFVNNYKSDISTRADSAITPDELKKRLRDSKSVTMEALLAGFGFKQFQIFQEGKHILTVEINGNKNIYWTGSDK